MAIPTPSPRGVALQGAGGTSSRALWRVRGTRWPSAFAVGLVSQANQLVKQLSTVCQSSLHLDNKVVGSQTACHFLKSITKFCLVGSSGSIRSAGSEAAWRILRWSDGRLTRRSRSRCSTCRFRARRPGLCRTPSQKYCRATKFIGRSQHLDRCRWKPGRISTISPHHVSGLDRASRVFRRASANPRRGDPPQMVSGDLWKDVYGLRGTRSPPRAEYAQQMCWSSDGDRTWCVHDTRGGQHRAC
jgi:hypothetical protein